MIELLRAVKCFFPLLGMTLLNMWQDLWYSSSVKRGQKEQLGTLMVANHTLEKGLTMPSIRLGFGYPRVRRIIANCRKYIKDFSPNHIEIQCSIDILQQYYDLHVKNQFDLPDDIVAGIKELKKSKLSDTKPCYETTKSEYFVPTDNFKDFAHSRHSVRWYSEETIPEETVIDAIELAKTAPSACNRQGIKIYVIQKEEKKKNVLNLQRGNSGWGHKADKILLITADMGYWKCDNRTAAFLDAGIFAMNLLYALHYYKICACTMNAILSNKEQKKLRNIVGYSKSEIPAVFISIGNAPEKFKVTGSQRVEKEATYEII